MITEALHKARPSPELGVPGFTYADLHDPERLADLTAAFEEAPEADRCLEAGRRRLPALLRRGSERAATRLRDYLLRRGYPPSEVMRTVARLTGARSGGPDETC